MVQTVPENLEPGSDVANLALLGYNAAANYTGRAPIEAAGAERPLAPNDVAVRCNLVTVTDGRMDDYSAGHITTEEAGRLIETLDKELGREGLRFHSGVSYRHLLIWRDGPADLTTLPPHEISGKNVEPHLPAGNRQDEFREIMEASKAILAAHPVNAARVAAGKKPATQVWLWGQGHALSLDPYQQLYGLTGGVISAVDLVRGLGLLAGLSAPHIPGATGFIDTNYQGKVDAALAILEEHAFVYVHIEAPDECGHMGDAALKTRAITEFDHKVVGPMWRALEERGQPYRLLICMDHRTPVAVRGHTREPVPLAKIDGPIGCPTDEAAFDEFVNDGTAEGMAHEWIRQLLEENPASH
jgi:2,3-bisphosphoglycerate-independent phosphoglycerate mutase